MTKREERIKDLVEYYEEKQYTAGKREDAWNEDFKASKKTEEKYWETYCREQRNIARAERKIYDEIIADLKSLKEVK